MSAAAAVGEAKGGGTGGLQPREMTSAEFYFDSNSHFGTHEEVGTGESACNLLCFDFLICPFNFIRTRVPSLF